jgi:hypothetical protein
MEPETSLPCSQVHATGPYPESDESSPHLPTLVLLGPFWYYSPIYALVFQVVSSLKVFRQKFYMHLSSFPCVLRALSIVSSFIWSS